MYRRLLKELIEWKNSENRKPLILNGARQVGKTWLLEELGKQYKDGFVRIDFEKNKDYIQLFEQTKDSELLIKNMCFSTGKKITVNTLLIFDEIQECPEALNSLKYFCEDSPQYHIAVAGSLLGLSLAKGFPVGKVSILHVGPLCFEEFLLACGKENLVDYMHSIKEIKQIPDIFINQLNDYLKMYLVIGGMPDVVNTWVTTSDISKVNKVIDEIIFAYERDFGKHAPFSDIQKIKYIWDSIPSQLARENKKFMYNVAKEGARAREYENALLWLVNSEDLTKVSRITKPNLPLAAYEEIGAFKIYSNDVGILRKKSNLPTGIFFDENNKLLSEFKGSLIENYVLQELRSKENNRIFYWSDENHEVDFIIQNQNIIIPIECKSGESIKSSSLKRYIEKYKDITPLAIRFSMKNLSFDGRILNIPLCLAGMTDKLLKFIPELS